MNIKNEKGNVKWDVLTTLFSLLIFCAALGVFWYFSPTRTTTSAPPKEEPAASEVKEIREGEELTGATEPAEVAELQTEPEAEEPQPSITIKIAWKKGARVQDQLVETIENLSHAYVDESRQLVLVFKEDERKRQIYNQHERYIPLDSILFWDFIGTNMREPGVY